MAPGSKILFATAARVEPIVFVVPAHMAFAVALEGGDGLLVSIELDEGRAGAFMDLRPTLPLLVRY